MSLWKLCCGKVPLPIRIKSNNNPLHGRQHGAQTLGRPHRSGEVRADGLRERQTPVFQADGGAPHQGAWSDGRAGGCAGRKTLQSGPERGWNTASLGPAEEGRQSDHWCQLRWHGAGQPWVGESAKGCVHAVRCPRRSCSEWRALMTVAHRDCLVTSQQCQLVLQ